MAGAALGCVDSPPNATLRASADVLDAYRGPERTSAIHPAVKVHPVTGKKALYAGERVRQFVGMTEAESRPLIDFLNRHAIRPEFIYRHRWRAHDLVMWDNRCLMHYAPLDYDPQTQPRFMWRCSLVGPLTGVNLGASERPPAASEVAVRP